MVIVIMRMMTLIHVPPTEEGKTKKIIQPEPGSTPVSVSYIQDYCEEETFELRAEKKADLKRDFGTHGL